MIDVRGRERGRKGCEVSNVRCYRRVSGMRIEEGCWDELLVIDDFCGSCFYRG